MAPAAAILQRLGDPSSRAEVVLRSRRLGAVAWCEVRTIRAVAAAAQPRHRLASLAREPRSMRPLERPSDAPNLRDVVAPPLCHGRGAERPRDRRAAALSDAATAAGVRAHARSSTRCTRARPTSNRSASSRRRPPLARRAQVELGHALTRAAPRFWRRRVVEAGFLRMSSFGSPTHHHLRPRPPAARRPCATIASRQRRPPHDTACSSGAPARQLLAQPSASAPQH